MMVAAFSVQTRLVSPHPPSAHSKPAETSLVSLFLRLILLLNSHSYVSEVNPEIMLLNTSGIPLLALSLLSFPGAEFNQSPKVNCTYSIISLPNQQSPAQQRPDRQSLLLWTALALIWAASQLLSSERKYEAASRTQFYSWAAKR